MLYACEPDDGLDVATTLNQWAQQDGLARLEGEWPQWPAALATPTPTKAGCGGCGAACACTGCRAEHDHAEDHP